MPKEFPDRVVLCDAIALSIQLSTQAVGVTFLDSDGQQVQLALPGVLIRALHQELGSALETVPSIVSWGCNAPSNGKS